MVQLADKGSLEALMEEAKMSIKTFEDSRADLILGKQLDRAALNRGELLLTDHLHVGLGPTPTWQYEIARRTAQAAGIASDAFTVATCSDDANVGIRKPIPSPYMYARPGGQVDFGELEVGFHEGHRKLTVLNIQHIGQYQKNENLYFGRIAGDEDGAVRGTCGLLDAVLKTLKTGQETPIKVKRLDLTHFQGLTEVAEELRSKYDLIDPAQYSEAMLRFVVQHMKAETKTIINGMKEINAEGHPLKFMVMEGIAINRFFKHPSTVILRNMYVVDGQQVYDLSEKPYAAKNEAALKSLKVIA